MERWMRENPQQALWLKEMMVRKELGYLPKDAREMAFVSTILFESNNENNENIEKTNKQSKLQALIAKNG